VIFFRLHRFTNLFFNLFSNRLNSLLPPERGSVTRSGLDEAKRKRIESEHVETVSVLRLTEPRSVSRPV